MYALTVGFHQYDTNSISFNCSSKTNSFLLQEMVGPKHSTPSSIEDFKYRFFIDLFMFSALFNGVICVSKLNKCDLTKNFLEKGTINSNKFYQVIPLKNIINSSTEFKRNTMLVKGKDFQAKN